jgi:D-xylose transport system permease protein
MKKFLQQNGVWIGLVVLSVFLTVMTQGDFLAPRNLSNLIRQAALNGVLAAGMTVIILTGGIDLSIGSLVALTGVLVGLCQVQWQLGIFETFVVAVGTGAVLGLINGGLVARLKIAPFVITLGMMVVARGFSMIFSGGQSISPMSESLNEIAGGYLNTPITAIALGVVFLLIIKSLVKKDAFKRDYLKYLFPLFFLGLFSYGFFAYKGMPHLAVFLLAVIGVTWFILHRTVFGRSIYAIGSNERAAYWAGVPIQKVKLLAYTFMGLLSGLVGFLLSGRLNGADPNAGQLFELDAIAAVVIGGVSLQGGRGSVFGSLIGALMIATLNNGMDLLGVSSFYQMVFKGIIIILAVSLDKNQRA